MKLLDQQSLTAALSGMDKMLLVSRLILGLQENVISAAKAAAKVLSMATPPKIVTLTHNRLDFEQQVFI